jgi:hypothetical protein
MKGLSCMPHTLTLSLLYLSTLSKQELFHLDSSGLLFYSVVNKLLSIIQLKCILSQNSEALPSFFYSTFQQIIFFNSQRFALPLQNHLPQKEERTLPENFHSSLTFLFSRIINTVPSQYLFNSYSHFSSPF